MALYEIVRSDDVKPGEFVSGYVIAGGTRQARQAVAHLEGVTKNGGNLIAARVDLTQPVRVLSVYNDEREPEPVVDYTDDEPIAAPLFGHLS